MIIDQPTPSRWQNFKERLRPSGSSWRRIALLLLAFILLWVILLGLYWSREPASFSVADNVSEKLGVSSSNVVTGTAMAATLIRVSETLLDKPGGYLSNDVMPPGLYLDNIPNWELGVLWQVRDLSRSFRDGFSRSQSQSTEDPDLLAASPHFSVDNTSWLFPAAESEYRLAIGSFYSYLSRISDSNNVDAQFYARADNLADWLLYVELRLGSLSQTLSASVGQQRFDTNMSGETGAVQSTPVPEERSVKTPWLEIDDVFYEARGSTWALMHFLKAAEIDFQQVLADKNATASLRQIIRELEESQRPLYFPVILNGSGFGAFANHSLTMANYISRANAAIIDLRRLLERG
ncbi:MAG: DUF2333 family protein [Pseudohongiellaceae bacterium]